jgi:hypothetical protein
VGAKSLLAALMVIVGMVVSPTTEGANGLALPAGARVGILVMMPTDVTHYHVGKRPTESFMRTYRVAWPASELVDDPLAAQLKNAGFEPVRLEASDELWRQRQQWIVSSPQATKLPKAATEEIGRIAASENLQALVIVAPGVNKYPEAVPGNRLRKLSAYVQGWGFSTSDEAGEAAAPVVFNLTQMLLVGNVGGTAEMVFREWGGGYVYEWPAFDPGADLKTLPPSEIDKLRPVIADVLLRQIERLMPHIKVAG